MTLAIITHTVHFKQQDGVFAYGPYVREMNIWTQFVDKVIVVAPVSEELVSKIDLKYAFGNLSVSKIPSVSLTSIAQVFRSIVLAPIIFFKIFKAMQQADHIHLRCPGNIGLIGCLVQILFPKKPKTAKYAGNWDPTAQQPLSYRFQKWLLSNTFWTKNMQVLVYGDWPNQTKNIKPFFTATYQKDKTELTKPNRRYSEPFRFMFVGALSRGKRPLYAIQLLEELWSQGIDCYLDFYGDGKERAQLEAHVAKVKCSDRVVFHGNETAEIVEQAYKKSHFLLLPSQSEGWPKVVAEAMFWGAIPMVTKISCVPWMLDQGKRGILLDLDLSTDSSQIKRVLNDVDTFSHISETAMKWSRNYTLNAFQAEIKTLLQ